MGPIIPILYTASNAAARALPWLIGGAIAYTTGLLKRLADERSSSGPTDYATSNYSSLPDDIELVEENLNLSDFWGDLVQAIFPTTHHGSNIDPSVGKNGRQIAPSDATRVYTALPNYLYGNGRFMAEESTEGGPAPAQAATDTNVVIEDMTPSASPDPDNNEDDKDTLWKRAKRAREAFRKKGNEVNLQSSLNSSNPKPSSPFRQKVVKYGVKPAAVVSGATTILDLIGNAVAGNPILEPHAQKIAPHYIGYKLAKELYVHPLDSKKSSTSTEDTKAAQDSNIIMDTGKPRLLLDLDSLYIQQ